MLVVADVKDSVLEVPSTDGAADPGTRTSAKFHTVPELVSHVAMRFRPLAVSAIAPDNVVGEGAPDIKSI